MNEVLSEAQAISNHEQELVDIDEHYKAHFKNYNKDWILHWFGSLNSVCCQWHINYYMEQEAVGYTKETIKEIPSCFHLRNRT